VVHQLEQLLPNWRETAHYVLSNTKKELFKITVGGFGVVVVVVRFIGKCGVA
jgi:hypothetical protein